MTDLPVVSGAPYPGAPVTYAEAQARGVDLRAPRWGLVDVAVAMLLALVLPLFVLSGAIAAGLPENGTVVLLGGASLPWIGLGLWPWLTTRIQGNGVRIDLGYAVRRTDLLWGLGGGVACLVLGSLAAAATQAVFGEFDSAAGNAVADADVARWVVIVFAMAALIGAPLMEELCFRGLAFAALARFAAKRGLPAVPWATIGSALLFTLIHLEPVRIPVLLTIGLVLSWLRARTGRVGASVLAHAFNNLWGVIGILTLAS